MSRHQADPEKNKRRGFGPKSHRTGTESEGEDEDECPCCYQQDEGDSPDETAP